jgi:hypothetical protein
MVLSLGGTTSARKARRHRFDVDRCLLFAVEYAYQQRILEKIVGKGRRPERTAPDDQLGQKRIRVVLVTY